MTRSPLALLRRAVTAGGIACLGATLALAPAAAAAGVNAGAATMTPAQGQRGTTFGISLPAGASCSGDTATKGYHVFSYVVPSAVDPGTLTFNASGPSQGNPLMFGPNNAGNQQYVGANTAPSTGQIIGLPTNFNFDSFDGSNASFGIPQLNGTYHVGIACADTAGNGDKYWDALVNFGPNPNVTAPTNWWSPAAQTPTPAGGSSMTGVLAAAGVAGVAGTAAVVRRRRSKVAPAA